MTGVMSSSQALLLAQNSGLDLVEIAPNAKPPTCKIMDYGKWKFENKKKEKQARKNQTKVLLKEIQLRPRTDEGDIKIKLQKARDFLNQGHKVKMNLRFFGREMAHKELGFKLLKNIEKQLADIALVESPPEMERRTLSTIFVLASSVSKSQQARIKNEQAKQESAKPPQIEKKLASQDSG